MATSSVSTQKTIEEIAKQTQQKQQKQRNTGQLGKDDFLNLLITQLRYQDPLNPTDDKEFIAQMAQFSALEQSQNMSTTMSKSQAFSMIGKYVSATTTNETTGKTEAVEGVVTNVKISDGKTYVVVNNKDILLDKVTEVSDSNTNSNSTNLSQYTNVIGYKVGSAIYDSTSGNIISVEGTVKSLEKGKYEDYAVMDGVSVEASTVTNAEGKVLDTADAIKSYLDTVKAGTNKAITLVAVDSTTGKKVPLKADLVDYTVTADGKIKTQLNGVYSPVESISKITK